MNNRPGQRLFFLYPCIYHSIYHHLYSWLDRFLIIAIGFLLAFSLPFMDTMAKAQSIQSSKIKVSKIRFGVLSNGGTRVVLESASKLDPKILLLASPYRIVVDMPNAQITAAENNKVSGIVAKYRHNHFNPNIYRLVLDLKSPAIVDKHFPLTPKNGYGYRYVIDLKPVSKSGFMAAAKKSFKPAPQRRTTATTRKSTAANKSGKKIIVLDPGHGGRDPGRTGIYGEHEAVLTLKIAKELKTQLEKSGRYTVYLTRKDAKALHRNKTTDLRMRYEVARKKNADLFISIHVDAIKNPKIKGATIYTLSENSSDKETARLVARENKSDIITGVDLNNTDAQVSGILIELAQRETMNYSAQLADSMVDKIKANNIRMVRNPHRFGPFLVLKAPDIPSILIETGFQTNREDAKLLNSVWGRRKLAAGIKSGIDNYFKTAKTSLNN